MAQKFLSGIRLIDGTAAAPSLSFTGDTNTGIYWSTYSGDSKQVNISTDGTVRASFNSAGITSHGNVYSSTSGQFRNYSGTWKATTGLTGNGFSFVNSVDGTAMSLSSTGNAVFAGSVTADTIVINDTNSTRGIFRNDSGYDLRLGGGVNQADGAYISLSGGTRGGGTSVYKGRVEIFAGGDNYSTQADITGDIVIGAHWSGGDKTILHLDSSNNNATFAGDVIATDGSDTATLKFSGLILSRSNSYIQSNADNSDTLNIGQSSVRWGHVKVDSATFTVLNGGNERFKINSSGNSSFYGDLSNVGSSHTVSLSSGSNIRGSNHLFLQGDASYVQIKSNGNNIYIDGAAHYFRNVAASANYLILSSTSATFSTNVSYAGTLTSTGSTTIPIYARSTSNVSYIQIQNSATGSNGSNDGLTVGVNGTAAYVWNREQANLYLGTNDTTAVTIDSSQNATFAGQLTVGSSGTGKDVMFYGDLAGEYFHWDENVSTVNIYHRDEYPGLEIYVNGGEQTTQPQLKVGRTSAQYWGAYVDDRNAHLLHRQDETSGIMTTRFDQWDSNTSDTTGKWEWRFGDGSGSNMDHAMVLTQGGALSELTTITASGEIQGGSLDINGNADISGNLTGVDNLTINGTLSGVSTATFAGDVQILTSSGEYAVYAAADGQTALYNNGCLLYTSPSPRDRG